MGLEPGLKDKVAVTTGANGGIGKAIALAYAEEGANLTLVARRPSPLEEVADSVSACGVQALPLAADITIGPPMPIGMYRGMSDRDVKAIVAYLRTVKPVRKAREVWHIPPKK